MNNTQPSGQIGLFDRANKDTELSTTIPPKNEVNSDSVSWKNLLKDEFEARYYQELRQKIKTDRANGAVIFPPDNEVFSALSLTPLDKVRVVILGQDPYHGPGQAHGLCFSVKAGVKPPPSLVNIFKEINQDLGIKAPTHGCLTKWAQQGVLLLNAVLTVQAAKPGAHQNLGWERFTDRIVSLLNERCSNLVFMLWGAYAHKKGAIIDVKRHLVLKAPHPSPFSANSGFFGCKHFSKCNSFLKQNGFTEIDWSL